MGSLMANLAQVWWRVRWHSQRGLRSLNQSMAWMGALVMLGVLVNALAWGWTDRQRAQLQNERAALAVEASNRTGVESVAGRDVKRVDWASFDSILLPDDGMPGLLHDLLNEAEDLHVEILSGEYALQKDMDGSFARHHLKMPVRGDAQVVRHFMERALSAHPSLSIQGLEFKRARIGDGAVEVLIQWVLLTRISPPPEGAP